MSQYRAILIDNGCGKVLSADGAVVATTYVIGEQNGLELAEKIAAMLNAQPTAPSSPAPNDD